MRELSLPLLQVWPIAARLGESPTWLREQRELLFIDGMRPSVGWLDPESGKLHFVELPHPISMAAPCADGRVLVASTGGLYRVDRAGSIDLLAPAVRERFNDGKCDPEGRLWIGTRSPPGSGGRAALYRFDGAELVEQVSGFDVCNGIAWSPAGTELYLVDTVPRIIYRFPYRRDTGEIGAGEVLCRFDAHEGRPDGLAVDTDGNLWCAMWDGACVQVIGPRGERLGKLTVPARRPTSCAFGGSDGDTLFVTSATAGLGPGEGFSDGAIFAFHAGRPGR